MININFLVEYNLWETVYVKTDPDVLARIITGYLYKGNNVLYVCSIGEDEEYYFEAELTRNIDNCLNKDYYDEL